jgi:diguanylate cyclase (GGDEF)-like protein/PAS domain S-box-containing protein
MARTRSDSTVGRRWAPAAVGVLVILGLGVAALRVGAGSLGAAEQDRINSRVNLTTLIGNNLGFELDPKQRGGITTVPFVGPEAGPVNEALLHQIQADPAVTGIAWVAVLTRDGRLVQATSPDVRVDVAALGDAWKQAIAGQMVLADAVRDRDGSVVSTTLWPVGEGQPWGVVAMGEVVGRTASQTFLAQLGSQNGEPGGLFIADRRGVVVGAWDPALIGQVLVNPAEFRSLAPGAPQVSTSGAGDAAVTRILYRQANDYVFGFQQDDDLLMRDLRDAQHQRDLTLVAVLVVALAGLIAFQAAREVAARRDEARVDGLLRDSQDVVAVARPDGTVAFVSAAVEELLGAPVGAWQGRPVGTLCHPDDAARLADLVADPGTGPLLNVRLRTADGDHRWFDVEARDLSDDAQVGGVLLTYHEVGERKVLQDELGHQATHDGLTGLANRAELATRLEALVVDGRPVRPFALLYLDLDRFKPVNDTLGHDAGDHVLVTIAERLRAAAPAGSLVARVGGDEFAVVLDGADGHAAVRTAEALLAGVREAVAVGDTLVDLDVSIGIALADPDVGLHSAEELVRQADEAMYRAKTGGRGRFNVAPTSGLDLRAPEAAPRVAPAGDVATGAPAPPAAGSGAVPAPPTTTPSRTRPAGRRRTMLLPLFLAGAVVVGTASVGFVQSRNGQRQAEGQWLQENIEGAARSAAFYSARFHPRWYSAMAEASPWVFDGGALDHTVVKMWATNPTSGPNSFNALLAPDGTPLASYPAGVTTGLTSDPLWSEIAAGRAVYLPWIEDSDEPRSYEALPIHRDGKVVAVLASGISVRVGAGQQALQRGGGSGYGSGGWNLVGPDGVVYSSWDARNIGKRLADVSQLRAIPAGEAHVIPNADNVVIVSPMTSTAVPTYLALDVSTVDFYRDLRLGQTERDLSLLGLVVAAVAGLALAAFRRERAVRLREGRLDALLQNAHDVVLLLDREGQATFVSSAVLPLLGYEPDETLRRSLLDLVHPDDRARVNGLVVDVGTIGWGSLIDVRVQGHDGRYRYFDVHAVDRRDRPEIGGIVLTAHDVTERKGLQDALVLRATHDPLTGLPNRASLTAHLDRLIEAADDAYAILFIDLDHFKPVNDHLGHAAGDEVLRVISERFAHSVRSGGDNRASDLLCRLGGDEFAVVLHDVTEQEARATGERLLAAARMPVQVGDDLVQVGATIGVAMSRTSWGHPDQAVRLADQAMYRAKQAGRNTLAMADA